MISVIRASEEDTDKIVPLFDQYRIFYKQPTDKQSVRNFLEERFSNNECVVFLAMKDDLAVGFTLLYTSFSSVSLKPIYILNDLYVTQAYRQRGIGQQLLQAAQKHCYHQGYKGLALETAIDNPAQGLYEKLGWEKDSHCFHYFWTAH